MGNRVTLWLLLLVLCFAVLSTGVVGYEDEEGKRREKTEEEEQGEQEEGRDLFLLQDAKHVVKTDAGIMKVVRGFGGAVLERPMHIGFITMEPQSLFIPQYVDSSMIIFIRRGEAKVGSVHKDQLVERNLKIGDLYRIPAGSTFYLLNTAEGQRLHVICSIDTSESLGVGVFQSFFIGGGTYPTPVLAGFEPQTLATAFNVSVGELKEVMTRQLQGPIVYVTETHPPNMWTQFLQLKQHERLEHLKKTMGIENDDDDDDDEAAAAAAAAANNGDEKKSKWSWRKLLVSVFGEENVKKGDNKKGSIRAHDSYNLYKRRPDFRNNYGWSTALDEHDYSPLRNSGIGIYLVNLTAGAMMAPHVNPTATEYGVVLRGSGSVQIVFPNGTLAMNARVKEGDVFWVPRYFPFCQIASRSGPFEFFGFTTSSRANRPQFLAGASSILRTMRSPELATSFGVSLEKLDRIINAQNEAIILPSPSAAPPEMGKMQQQEEKKMKNIERMPKVIKSLGNEMILGFD